MASSSSPSDVGVKSGGRGGSSPPPPFPDLTPPPKSMSPGLTPSLLTQRLVQPMMDGSHTITEATLPFSSVEDLRVATPPPPPELTVADACGCSEAAARRALRRSNQSVSDAIAAIQLRRESYVLIVIGFCNSQESFFEPLLRTLALQPYGTSDAIATFLATPVVPYFVKGDEFAEFAPLREWRKFLQHCVCDDETLPLTCDSVARLEALGFTIAPRHTPSNATTSTSTQRTARAPGVIGVITGNDGAAPLVDFVNEALFGDACGGTLGNPYRSFEMRQSKSVMHDALRDSGLTFIRSMKARCADDARSFAEEMIRDAGSVIVKPEVGAGSEFVSVCCSFEDVERAFYVALQGHQTTQLLPLECMVVQEYIDGQEYVVDTVSFQKHHVVTDVWRSIKFPVAVTSSRARGCVERTFEEKGAALPQVTTTSLIYDRLDFVADVTGESDAEAHAVCEYTLQVLDALELVNGCAHCELRIRRDGRPVLIELNARMQGDVPRSTNLVNMDQYGVVAVIAHILAHRHANASVHDTRDSTVAAPLDLHALFPPRYPPPALDVTRSVLFLFVKQSGYICEPGRRYLTQLPTFVRFTRSTAPAPSQPGFIVKVRQTTDLYSCPAAIILEGTRAAIDHDIAVIRKMENGFATESGWMWRLKIVRAKYHQFRNFRKIVERFRLLVCSNPQDDDYEDDDPDVSEDVDGDASAVIRMPLSAVSTSAADGGWLEVTPGFLEDLAKQDDASDGGVVARLVANMTSFASLKQVAQLHQSLQLRQHAFNVEVMQLVRSAKSFLVQCVVPPPLFISYEEWDVIYEAGCSSILGS